MNLDVSRKSISEILGLLMKGEWQAPKFQREYIWNVGQARELFQSVFRGYPIGMITTWAQPQNNPHTEPVPLKLGRGAFESTFKDFAADPAVVKLVLDGKQRLTTLAHGFGGLRSKHARDSFGGRWFLDFKQPPGSSDDFIIHKKRKEVEDEGLNTLAKCISLGYLPLDNYREFSKIRQKIYDPAFYPAGEMPAGELLDQWAEHLAAHLDTFTSFQIPYAELSSDIGLAEVCDIFEVLNTTGTKVSTFDLIHNTVWGDTAGTFDLRQRFKQIETSSERLSFLFESSRQDYVCQLMTGMYMASADGPPKYSSVPAGTQARHRNGVSNITSIKGGDLLGTPTGFYQTAFEHQGKLAEYANGLFAAILGAPCSILDIPYPASTILYFSLRWRMDFPERKANYGLDKMNSFFRAFYWRNVLSQRYDQGFLTKFSDDLWKIDQSLSELTSCRGSSWKQNAADQLDSLIPAVKTEEEIQELLLDGELRGAMKQALTLFLHGHVLGDIVTGAPLERFSTDPLKRVELHHIFPKVWCKDNKAHHSILSDDTIPNCFANLIPLSAKSNGEWKSKAPKTAVDNIGKPWSEIGTTFESAFIPDEVFQTLVLTSPNPEQFWRQRAKLMAKELHAFQLP